MNSSITSSSNSSRSACSSRPAASKASIASTRFLRSRCSTCSDSSSRERALELLLGRAEGAQEQRQRVAARVVAREPASRELALDVGDQRHSNPGRLSPPRTCQCRWNTVWPPPGSDVDDHAVVLEPGQPAVSATKRSMRPASSSGKSSTSRNVSTWRSGRTRRCVGAFGAMSRIATKPSAAWTWSPSADEHAEEAVGIRRQRRAPPPPRPDRAGAARSCRRRRRRARACSRPHTRGRAGRRARRRSLPTRARQRRRESSSESARSRAPRSRLTAGGTVSSSAVRVPGRGEYGKTCTFVIPTRSTSASVRSNAASSSAGKPTITSVVRLKPASGASRRSNCDAV